MRTRSLVMLLVVWACGAAPARTSLEIGPENAATLNRLARYPDLEKLSIRCLENLQALPESIGNLTKLRELILDNGNGCAMNPRLPESIGNLQSLEKLVLFGAQDPATEGDQPHQRHPFPASMSRLRNLRSLDLGRNNLTEVPAFAKDLPRLEELGLEWNLALKIVPRVVAQLRELKTLRLDADGLQDLPDFLNEMPNLALVTLGDNHAITRNAAKMHQLRKRFPKLRFHFQDEYVD